jgi:hypothetical protein
LQYYYSHNGADQLGPVSAEEFKALKLAPHTLVWREGMASWLPASQVPELAGDGGAVAAGVAAGTAVVDPAPQQPQGYGPVGYQQTYANAPVPNNGMAIASLVCGVTSVPLSCFVVPGILAIIFGHIARAQIRRGQGGGDGMALTGLICGYVMTAVTALGYAVYVFLIVVFAVSASNRRPGPNPGPGFPPTPPGNVFHVAAP